MTKSMGFQSIINQINTTSENEALLSINEGQFTQSVMEVERKESENSKDQSDKLMKETKVFSIVSIVVGVVSSVSTMVSSYLLGKIGQRPKLEPVKEGMLHVLVPLADVASHTALGVIEIKKGMLKKKLTLSKSTMQLLNNLTKDCTNSMTFLEQGSSFIKSKEAKMISNINKAVTFKS